MRGEKQTNISHQRTSYTVIMTYFFYEGKIYVILNKLQKLSTEDYDSQGTAIMVIKTLCESLGYTKSKLSKVLKHLVYDGGRQKIRICLRC
jgi:DNA-binding MarR family transcriptional regulator